MIASTQSRQVEFIPAVLEESIEQAQQLFDAFARLAPQPKAIQVDIIDGEFADMLTLEPSALELIDTHNLPLDIHLMTQEPIDFVAELQNLPSVRSVIGQVEHMSSLRDFAQEVRSTLHAQVGFSLDLHTPLSAIDIDMWPEVDILQIMANTAGEQGLPFSQSSLVLLEEANALRAEKNLHFSLAVDIGINLDTAPLALRAGADMLAVGSFLSRSVSAEEQQVRWQQLQTVVPQK